MSITKSGGVITETPINDKDQTDRTGVRRADSFAVCDNVDKLKQIQMDPSGLTTNVVYTYKAPAAAANTTAIVGPAPESNAGNSGSTLTVNFATAPNQKVTMTASCTFTFSGAVAGDTLLLKLVQGGSGSYTATWPGTVKWPSGTAPTLSTSVASIDIVTFYYDGTNYFGASGLAYA